MESRNAADSNAPAIAASRTKTQKRLVNGQRISACVGNYIADQKAEGKKKERLFGNIIKAVGERRYLVQFDNETNPRELGSQVLKVETIGASLPPDIPIPAPNNPREVVELENIEEVVGSQDDEEHLPAHAPEHDEVEAEREGSEDVHESQQDQEGRMPGQLERISGVQQQAVSNYETVKIQAEAKIAALIGKTVLVKDKRGSSSIQWKVIQNHIPQSVLPEKMEDQNYGLIGFNKSNYKRSEIYARMFLALTFIDWKKSCDKMNTEMMKDDENIRPFSYSEFLVGLGLLIGACGFSQNGINLFKKTDHDMGDGEDGVEDDTNGFVNHPAFDQYMPFYRFKSFRRYFPGINVDATKEGFDPWHHLIAGVEEFNQIRRERISASNWILIDESMSSWRPRTSKTGKLPNISFILRKPKPLGTEFKTTGCSITGVMRCLEIQR